MHFWIDKRSQQCGFGRSRVAASLSGAGGSGVGLSFGHPPRRISSGSGSKSNSRNALPDCHHSNAAGSSSSRSHQYQHQHQQHQQQQQQICNNNNFSVGHNHQQSYVHNSNTSNYTTNSSTANATATTGATMPSATTVTLNNNTHQHAYQQAHLHASTALQSQHAPGNINIMNNNNASISSTSTAMSGGNAPTTHNFNQRGAALLQSNVGTSNTPLYPQHANQCYDMRNYHHPQFGNMSVRHYQHPSRNCNGPTHVTANSAAQAYRSGGVGNQSGTRTIIGNTTAAPSMNTLQHMDQMPYRQPHGYSHSATANAQSNESIMGASAPICTNTTNTTSYAVANTAHRYSSAALNMRTSNMTVDAGGGDAQLLPSHLKCGMCASLVLASVFVAGAKFYLDHQGTGLEVLIFCAFSATFFLAACTVSLCRVPKGLLPSGRNAVLGTQHHSDADNTMHCARAPYGRRDIVNGDGSGGGELVGSDDIHGAPLCGQLQLIEDSASAGPPPYHIAIYFPETENSSKSKEAPIEDESPPPSYDKILI